jgi:hypothetical protein
MPSIKINVAYRIVLPAVCGVRLELNATPEVCNVKILISDNLKRRDGRSREKHCRRAAKRFNVLSRSPKALPNFGGHGSLAAKPREGRVSKLLNCGNCAHLFSFVSMPVNNSANPKLSPAYSYYTNSL